MRTTRGLQIASLVVLSPVVLILLSLVTILMTTLLSQLQLWLPLQQTQALSRWAMTLASANATATSPSFLESLSMNDDTAGSNTPADPVLQRHRWRNVRSKKSSTSSWTYCGLSLLIGYAFLHKADQWQNLHLLLKQLGRYAQQAGRGISCCGRKLVHRVEQSLQAPAPKAMDIDTLWAELCDSPPAKPNKTSKPHQPRRKKHHQPHHHHAVVHHSSRHAPQHANVTPVSRARAPLLPIHAQQVDQAYQHQEDHVIDPECDRPHAVDHQWQQQRQQKSQKHAKIDTTPLDDDSKSLSNDEDHDDENDNDDNETVVATLDDKCVSIHDAPIATVNEDAVLPIDDEPANDTAWMDASSPCLSTVTTASVSTVSDASLIGVSSQPNWYSPFSTGLIIDGILPRHDPLVAADPMQWSKSPRFTAAALMTPPSSPPLAPCTSSSLPIPPSPVPQNQSNITLLQNHPFIPNRPRSFSSSTSANSDFGPIGTPTAAPSLVQNRPSSSHSYSLFI
ncbi:hypothetical protein BC940DRAFT_293750 [Gongronella butleri]|nr:hypothetical protein BC940DRAFT_293750 [Gongronella butleri]